MGMSEVVEMPFFWFIRDKEEFNKAFQVIDTDYLKREYSEHFNDRFWDYLA